MGKPLAGQLGQMGSPSQSQMGGGFGGSQPQLRQPALESPYNGSGGGGMQLPGMGTFQDFIRQQQMSGGFGGQQPSTMRNRQMPQQSFGGFQPQFGGGFGGFQPQFGGFQPQFGGGFGGFQPQFGGGFGGFQPQFGGGFGGFQPQFGGGFGGFQPQFGGGFGGGYQPSRQRFNQMPQQMPMIGPGGGNRDFYDRQMQPPQEFGPSQAAAQAEMLQSMGIGQNSRPDLTGGPMGAPQTPQPQVNSMQSQQETDPMRQAIQSGIRNGQFSPRALSRADMMGRLGEMTTVNSGAPTPQAPAAMSGAPQTDPRFRDGGAVTEDPRMQAMRGIQQLANRQRGFR